MLLILKAPWLEEKLLQSQIRRLVISLQARIVDGPPAARDGAAAASETIYTGQVDDPSDPFIVVDEEEAEAGDSTTQFIYAVWKLPVFLSRPQMQSESPYIIFSASAGLRPEHSPEPLARGSGYLQSGQPSSVNLLESFANDPALHTIKPRLSALRVSRVAPITGSRDHMIPLRALPQLRLPVFPVLHAAVRFSRPGGAPSSSTLIALLDVDFTPHFGCDALIDSIELTAPDATVDNLNDDPALNLPLTCSPHDHVTFLYQMRPRPLSLPSRVLANTLELSLAVSVLVIPDLCVPRLSISWSVAIDLAPPAMPNFGPSAMGASIQRPRRPSQLSLLGNGTKSSAAHARPDSLPTPRPAAGRSEASPPDLGITVSFTGPSEPIRAGDVFSWTVNVVNRTSDQNSRSSRRLALIAIPKRRRNETRPLRPHATSPRRPGEKAIADPVLDENVLHAMQRNASLESADVVCLNADTRLGPLLPDTCHVVELHFLALQEGIIEVEAIRIVDLGSQEHVDIRDLPTTIVEAATA